MSHMSRDICLSLRSPASGRVVCFGCASSFWRADEVAAENLARGQIGYEDLVVVGQREDTLAGVCGAGAEVVHASGSAEAHFAVGIEPVVAQPVVALSVPVAGWERLRCGTVGLAWCASAERAVRASLVVVRSELVELKLQIRDGCGGRPGPEPALLGLVEALDLALGLGMSGRAVLLPDAEDREQVLERIAPAGEPGRVDAPVVRQRARRRAVFLDQL